MTIIIIVAYILVGVTVGILCSNVYLNRAYRKNLPSYYNPRYAETPDYIAKTKESAYKRAVIDSQVDRNFSFFLGGMCWPIAIFILLGYYIKPWWSNIPRVSLGLSSASREVKKFKTEVVEAEKQKALEAKAKEEWNTMVDILNENKLNEITKYEKR